MEPAPGTVHEVSGAAAGRRATIARMHAMRPADVTVVGLGPGAPDLATGAALAALTSARLVWLRTARHPARAVIPASVPVRACDDLYEARATFDQVYRAIAERVVASAAEGPVVYAVPGDPTVGEASVTRIRALAAHAGLTVAVVPGVSFLGPTLGVLGWDALDGLQVVDATALAARHYPDLDPDRPALVAQVYNRLLASDVKLVLLAAYPPDHPVTVVAAAGAAGTRAETVPLVDLDRGLALDDLTTLAVPPLPGPGAVAALADLVARLRAPDGCPWDREQTHRSLRPYLLEEAYEVLQALDDDDPDALREELGDLLLQIVLHCQLAAEAGLFTLPQVVAVICDKIVRRHPHVFGDAAAHTSAEVRVRWEDLKRREKGDAGPERGPLDGLPAALPALARAQAAQRKLHDAGRDGAPAPSDWDEETATRAATVLGVDPGGAEARARRVGGALWALAAEAGAWDVDAESALREEIAAREAAERRGRP